MDAKNSQENLAKIIQTLNECNANIINTNEFSTKINLKELRILDCVREIMYFNIKENLDYSENIFEISQKLMSLIGKAEEFGNKGLGECEGECLCVLENIMFLCLFHFHTEYVYNGYVILKFFVDNLDFDYHKELLQNFVKIIHILKVKKSLHTLVCTKIISNLSNALVMIISNSNNDTKKCLIDFIKLNLEDYIFVYIVCMGTSSGGDFAKFFSNDIIVEIIDKYTKQFEKQLTNLEGLLNKFDNTITTKTRIKQAIDVISCIGKIMDSFTIKGNRSYSLDKSIKNVNPLLKNFWGLILYNPNLYDLDIAVDSIQNLINFSVSIDCLDFHLLLPLLNWNGILLRRNVKYMSNTLSIVNLMSMTDMPMEAIPQISEVVLEIVEKILENPQNQEDLALLIFDSLEKFPKNFPLMINDTFEQCKSFYNESRKENEKKQIDKISQKKENENNENKNNENKNDNQLSTSTSTAIHSLSKSCEIYIKEFNEILLEHTHTKIKVPSIQNLFQASLSKFEEFKNSLKAVYNLTSQNLNIDNKFSNFSEKSKMCSPEENEKFFVETAMDMFKEIFNYNQIK